MPDAARYGRMPYRRCGRSGLRLSALSLGLWHNFGSVDPYDEARGMVCRAFDLGITHFDLANNYGPEPGTAEETFGLCDAASRPTASVRLDEHTDRGGNGIRNWMGEMRKLIAPQLGQQLSLRAFEVFANDLGTFVGARSLPRPFTNKSGLVVGGAFLG